MIPNFKVRGSTEDIKFLIYRLCDEGYTFASPINDEVDTIVFAGDLIYTTREMYNESNVREYSLHDVFLFLDSHTRARENEDEDEDEYEDELDPELSIPEFKVRVNPIQSRQIQMLVFRMGGKWIHGVTSVTNEHNPFLYFGRHDEFEDQYEYVNEKTLLSTPSEEIFNSKRFAEYTYNEIYSTLSALCQDYIDAGLISEVEPESEGQRESNFETGISISGHIPNSSPRSSPRSNSNPDSYGDDWSGTDRLINKLSGLLGFNDI